MGSWHNGKVTKSTEYDEPEHPPYERDPVTDIEEALSAVQLCFDAIPPEECQVEALSEPQTAEGIYRLWIPDYLENNPPDVGQAAGYPYRYEVSVPPDRNPG